MVCVICKAPATRMVVRDDYDQIRASFPLPLTEDTKDRMYGVLDRLVDGYNHTSCDKSHNQDPDTGSEKD